MNNTSAVKQYILVKGTKVIPFALEYSNFDVKIKYLSIHYNTLIDWHFTDWDILLSGVKNTKRNYNSYHIVLPKQIPYPNFDLFIVGFLAPKSKVSCER